MGQETLWLRGEPVWAMNNYGYIKRPDLIDAERVGATIKAALSDMYSDGRFLGGFEWADEFGRYVDISRGDAGYFHGRESIIVGDATAYALDYFGGKVKT